MRIAIAQTPITTSPHANGTAVRDAVRRAADRGARLVHLSEGALSGYAGMDKAYYRGWDIDWAPVTEQLRLTAELAGRLGVWIVAGGNHRLGGEHRPHNSLWIIDDRGTLADRYDKRYLSHAEVGGFYTPGDHPCTFEVDGFRFGCLICIEVNYPELWRQQRDLGVDCVLFSTFSEDPIFEVMARGHAAAHGYWVSVAVPAQCAHAGASALIGPHGHVLGHARPDGPDLLVADLDRGDPALDVALTKARPWRDIARQGAVYDAARVDDPRSRDRRRY